MKKRLLLSVFAVLAALGMNAHEPGEYVYTSTQRFFLSGENLIQNPTFADITANWTDAERNPVSAEGWSVEQGVGPDGTMNALMFTGADSEASLCQVVELEPSETYVLSFKIKGEASGSTDKATAFINTDGALLKGTNSTETPVIDVLTSATYSDEWTEVVATVFVSDTLVREYSYPTLVINFTGMPTGLMVTDFSVNRAIEVFDIRQFETRFAYYRMIMEDPNFNVPEAATEKENLESTIAGIEPMLATGTFNDFSTSEGMIVSLDEMFEAFMAVTTDNMASEIKTLDFASLAGVGRGRGFGSSVSNLTLSGGNWGHVEGTDCLMSAIQTGQKGHTATFTVSNVNFPAGKYFFTAEIRNAYTGKSSWPCPEQVFNLETNCRMSIGETTQDIGPVVGEAYQRFYMVADVAEDGQFTASVAWPGTNNDFEDASANNGGAFYIRSVQVRGFGNALEKAARLAAWYAFKTQYDGMVGARNKLLGMIGDKNYPWSQGKLTDALAAWDPYYNEFMAKGWVTSDGKDTGVATIDELNDFATTTGVHDLEAPYDKYALVRGYQYATDAVITDNQPFTTLAEAIDAAKKTRNQGVNLTGDRDTYKQAILAAIATIQSVRNTTTDETREADIVTLETALQTLNDATDAFLASVTIAPIVDIDFSNPFVETETGYTIKGNAGEMTFDAATVELDNTINTYSFCLGYNGELNDVLHVGGDSYGTVQIADVTSSDQLVFTFDLWYGQLGKAYDEILLLNAAGERVAGFSLDGYNWDIRFNEFNNAENTGMFVDNTTVYSNHDKNGGPVSVCTESLRNNFELTIDYSKGVLKGSILKGKKKVEGVEIAIPTPTSGDNIITAFQVGGYNHAKANAGAYGRRAWFDNLKIMKTTSAADLEEDITESPWAEAAGINTVTVAKSTTNAIYTLSGVQVTKAAQKGIYIQNGKKFVVK